MFGRSTTIRAGEESVSTLGVTVPLAVISMLMPPSAGTISTFCNAARVAVASVSGVCAPAISTTASGGYFYHKTRQETNPGARDVTNQEGLLAACEELSGAAMPAFVN